MRNFRNIFCFSIFCLLVLVSGRLNSAPSLIDNLVVASGRSYEIIEDGLDIGQFAYIDRKYAFINIPDYFQGTTYIKTANDDKSSKDDGFLKFDVNQIVTVYVGYDIRIPEIPIWLSNFTNIGKNVVTSDTTFKLFAKDFSHGTITLGGNSGTRLHSMYTVIIVGQELPFDNIPPAPPIGVKVIELWIRYK